MASANKEIIRLRYKNYNWDKPFNPKDYSNPEAITILYENWLQSSAEATELREQISRLNKEKNEIEKANAVLVEKHDTQQKQRWFPFSLQLVSIITTGIGVNLITSADNIFYGWVFIALSIILEIIAFTSLAKR